MCRLALYWRQRLITLAFSRVKVSGLVLLGKCLITFGDIKTGM
jgi:hypothetical protein